MGIVPSPTTEAINVGADDPRRPHDAVWYPSECLTILPRQQVHPKIQQLFVSDIITFAARNANTNRDYISTEGMQYLGLQQSSNRLVSFDRATRRLASALLTQAVGR